VIKTVKQIVSTDVNETVRLVTNRPVDAGGNVASEAWSEEKKSKHEEGSGDNYMEWNELSEADFG
jgi:hypothetical protein